MLFKNLFSILLVSLLFLQLAHAQNKVVVIPMAGDDVAMAQQHFRYSESANANGGSSTYMCLSDVYNTPNQDTQVLLIANGNARFATDHTYWVVNVQVSKDSGVFTYISGFHSFSEANSGSWSQISTTDILDLEPNSSYQFRVALETETDSPVFSSAHSEYCELVVSASYKLPVGKNILEVIP